MNDQARAVDAPAGWADPTVTVPRAVAWQRSLPLLAWLGCLGVAIGLLLVLGEGRLAAPALTTPASWAAWARDRDPVEVAMVVARLLGLGLAWYLVGVTTVSVLARVLRAARLVRVADALSVGPVRIVVQQALGVGLATGILTAAVPAGPAAQVTPASAATAEVEILAPRSGATHAVGPVSVVQRAAAVGATVEVLAPIPAPLRGTAAATAPAAAPTTAPDPPAASDAGADAEEVGERVGGTRTGATREVRVRPGDHFWAIAERDVSAHLGRPATEAEVAVHWRATVTANSDRLRVPDNPDVLLPGQVVVLPAVDWEAP